MPCSQGAQEGCRTLSKGGFGLGAKDAQSPLREKKSLAKIMSSFRGDLLDMTSGSWVGLYTEVVCCEVRCPYPFLPHTRHSGLCSDLEWVGIPECLSWSPSSREDQMTVLLGSRLPCPTSPGGEAVRLGPLLTRHGIPGVPSQGCFFLPTQAWHQKVRLGF